MVKYLIMDVDGTLTDGKIYMGPSGEVMKAFSIKDGYAISHILNSLGIVPVVITARTSTIVQRRCDELGIKEVYQGKLDKYTTLKEIVGDDNLEMCAYFGDDVIDIKCMAPIKIAGGIVGCPADAVPEVKALADYICVKQAGEGALREFVEWIVSDRCSSSEVKSRIDFAVEYLKQLDISLIDIGKKIEVNDYFSYTIQNYETQNVESCKLESHRKHVDIQIMISGEEYIDCVDINRLNIQEPYDPQKDVMFWEVPDRMSRVHMVNGSSAIFFPQTAHRGGIVFGTNAEKVVKIVGKVLISNY